jgi:hypothetical protein
VDARALLQYEGELKRNINDAWRQCVQRYPEVLDYYFGLVMFRLPETSNPPFSADHDVDAGRAEVPTKRVRRTSVAPPPSQRPRSGGGGRKTDRRRRRATSPPLAPPPAPSAPAPIMGSGYPPPHQGIAYVYR